MGRAMMPTSLSLLERLRQAGSGHPDWQRLDDLYRPLIRSWVTRVPGLGDEADDLTQEVLLILFRELPGFERRRDGSFRAWLRQITINRIRRCLDKRRRRPQPASGPADEADAFLNRLEDPNGDLSRQWDEDHDQHLFGKLLALVRSDFSAMTWEAFTRFALRGEPASEVADVLGISEQVVFQSKFRVLKRLREEAAGLLGQM
jgi:RNA polymerase sigma-70 factor (ECF subfamily)